MFSSTYELLFNMRCHRVVSCSHQTSAIMACLLRGDDAVRLKLAGLSEYESTITSPHRARGLQINVSTSKTNPGDRVDNRAIVPHRHVHQDALLHLALRFWQKLNPPNGTPIDLDDLLGPEWCAKTAVPCTCWERVHIDAHYIFAVGCT